MCDARRYAIHDKHFTCVHELYTTITKISKEEKHIALITRVIYIHILTVCIR